MTKGSLSCTQPIMCDLTGQWFSDIFTLGVLTTFPAESPIPTPGTQTAAPHPRTRGLLHKCHPKLTATFLMVETTPYPPADKTSCGIFPHQCGVMVSHPQAACIPSVASARKTWSSVAWALLPFPWMKLRLYCLFWGNENKTQVPCTKRR